MKSLFLCKTLEWKNVFSFLIITFFSLTSISQVEELIEAYPSQKGKERVQTIIDISYALHRDDVPKSKYYGALADKEAKILGDSALLANVWNDWSFVYLYGGNLDSAIILNKQALNYRTGLRDTLGMAKSLNKIAMAYHEKGEYKKSLDANLKSLEYFKKVKFDLVYGQVYNNIAADYESTNNYEGALTYFTKAIEHDEEYGNLLSEVRARINRGNALKNLGRIDEAQQQYQEMLPKVLELDEPETVANYYMNLGGIERELNNDAKAAEYYETSYNYFKKADMISATPLILGNLSSTYMDLGKVDKAEPFLQEAMKLAKQSGSLYSQVEVYKMFARLEVIKGNSEKADEYLEMYIAFNDSINSAQNSDALAEMQTKFDIEENKLELAEEKIKTKTATIWLLVSVVFIILLIVIIWWIAQRKRIEAKNAELKIIKNIESERVRIARDLHDNLGAELTLITSKLDTKSFTSQNEAEKNELFELSEISRNANFMLRETIWSIYKEAISIDELISKSEDYLARLFEDTTVNFNVLGKDNPVELSPAVALHLYRIIQESSNNAFKYSNCKNLTIEINREQVSISDDGKGFELDTVKKGYGLQNIAERVKEMDAQLQVNSSLGKGTNITVKY